MARNSNKQQTVVVVCCKMRYVLVAELVGWESSSKSEGSIWDKSPFGRHLFVMDMSLLL
jgi:hypothetical protein